MDRHRVTSNLVRNAASEVFGKRFTPHWLPWVGTAAAAALIVMTTLLLWNLHPWKSRSSAATANVASSGKDTPVQVARATTSPTAGSGTLTPVMTSQGPGATRPGLTTGLPTGAVGA